MKRIHTPDRTEGLRRVSARAAAPIESSSHVRVMLRRLVAGVLACVLVLVALMGAGVLGNSPAQQRAFAAEPVNPTLAAPAHQKTVKDNGNGTYTISLNVTGASSTSTGTVSKNQPLDIVLVLDMSGSMWDSFGTTTRIDALKSAVNNFVDATAKENDKVQDPASKNQISIVKFAGDKSDNVGNERYGGWWDNEYNYTQIVHNLTSDLSDLKTSVDGLQPGGETRADYGVEMAQRALANKRAKAKQVVIFFTDGVPTDYSSFSPEVANDAVRVAAQLKKEDASVYSIGVFDGANPSDTSSPVNSYMNAVSSNYPRATSYTELGQRDPNSDYYKTATNASQLNNIFQSIQQEISKTATYTDVTIHDKLSQWFVGAGKASVDGKPSDFTYTKTDEATGKTTPWTDAPAAKVAADGTVSWPVVSSDVELEKGVTYTLSFTVKPTQKAYDQAAAGLTALPTNDGASLDYKTVVTDQSGNKVTSESRNVSYETPTVTVPVSTLTIVKQWKGAEGQQLPQRVTVQVKQDGKDFGEPVELTAAMGWKTDMTVPAGPEGHAYAVSESAVEGYKTTYGYAVDGSSTTSQADGTGVTLKGATAQKATATITNELDAFVNLSVYKYVAKNGSDTDGTPLAGARFKIVDAKGAPVPGAEKLTSGVDGKTGPVKLNPGTYTLSETWVPAGYTKLSHDVTFTVSATGQLSFDSGKTWQTPENKAFTVKVGNIAIADMPQTGGMGNVPLYAAGVVLVGGAAAYLAVRRGMFRR